MAWLSRRFLLQTATVGTAALTTARASAQAPAPAGYDAAAMAASISARLFAEDGTGATGPRYADGLEPGDGPRPDPGARWRR